MWSDKCSWAASTTATVAVGCCCYCCCWDVPRQRQCPAPGTARAALCCAGNHALLLCSCCVLLLTFASYVVFSSRLSSFVSLLSFSLFLFLFALWTYLKIVLSLVTFWPVAAAAVVVSLVVAVVAVYCVNMKVEKCRKKRR